MGYKLKNICPYISFGGSACHHRYGPHDKKDSNKTICAYHNNQSQCPLFKLWKAQLDIPFNDDKKKKVKLGDIENFIKSK